MIVKLVGPALAPLDRKVFEGTVVIVVGKVTLFNELKPRKEQAPIVVPPLIIIVVRDVQSVKKPLHPNVESANQVVTLGIVTDCIEVHPLNTLNPNELIVAVPCHVTDDNAVKPLNDPNPMDIVDPVLKTTVFNDVDPLKVLSPILVTADVKVTDVMKLQFCKNAFGTLTDTVKLFNNDVGHVHVPDDNVEVHTGVMQSDEAVEPAGDVVPGGQAVLK